MQLNHKIQIHNQSIEVVFTDVVTKPDQWSVKDASIEQFVDFLVQCRASILLTGIDTGIISVLLHSPEQTEFCSQWLSQHQAEFEAFLDKVVKKRHSIITQGHEVPDTHNPHDFQMLANGDIPDSFIQKVT